jgi:hypothetical protein
MTIEVRAVENGTVAILYGAALLRAMVDAAETTISAIAETAQDSADDSAASASASAASATASAGSATAAATSATAGDASEAAAAASATLAGSHATAAANSATLADASADAADLSEAGAASALAGVLAELDGVTITTAMFNAANRAMLQALDHTQGFPATLLQDGGVFVPTPGNFTVLSTADAGQAKYVPWSTGAANGAWVRVDPIWWTPEMAQCAGDGVADDGPKIKYLLTLGNVRGTPGAVYATASPIMMPSNRTFWLNGCELKMLVGFANAAVGGNTINAVLATHTTTGIRVVGPGVVNGNKVGLGGGDAARKNGIMAFQSPNMLIQGVTGRNCTGYIFYPNVGTTGKIDLCHAENGQYHYEFMAATDWEVTRCTSGDGDGDIGCSGWLHPVYNSVGCKRIRISDFYGYGAASSGLYILGSGALANEDITLSNCRIEITSSGSALVISGGAGTSGVKCTNSDLLAPGGYGIISEVLTEGFFSGCTIEGKAVAVQFAAGSQVDFLATKIVASAAPGVGAFGIDAAGSHIIKLDGRCVLDVTSNAGESPTSGAGIYLERGTRLLFSASPDIETGQLFITGTTNYPALPYFQEKDMVLTWDNNNQTVEFLAAYVSLMPLGSRINIKNATANSSGRIVTVFGTGVTIRSPGGVTTIKAWGEVTATKSGAAEVMLSGDLG